MRIIAALNGVLTHASSLARAQVPQLNRSPETASETKGSGELRWFDAQFTHNLEVYEDL